MAGQKSMTTGVSQHARIFILSVGVSAIYTTYSLQKVVFHDLDWKVFEITVYFGIGDSVSSFRWSSYLEHCDAQAAPDNLFTKVGMNWTMVVCGCKNSNWKFSFFNEL